MDSFDWASDESDRIGERIAKEKKDAADLAFFRARELLVQNLLAEIIDSVYTSNTEGNIDDAARSVREFKAKP